MPFRLLSHEKCPPGSFLYEQPFNGAVKKFGSTPLINELVARVADFRRGNGIPRTDPLEVLEDIDAFNCARLGNSPRWTYNTERAFAEIASPLATAPCATCGGQDAA